MNISRNFLRVFDIFLGNNLRDTMPKLLRFSFLLPFYVCLNLASSSDVFSTIPAPTNISVTCHNFKNVLYWNYSKPDLQPEFYITIHGYQSKPMSVYTSHTYLDISEYTQEADNSYYITVEAQPEGLNKSIPSKGINFSYNEDFDSAVTCVVDFPVLDVSVLPHKVELSFSHPYHVHKIDSLNESFLYTVLSNQTVVYKDECYVEDDVCRAEFNLFESVYGSCMNVHITGFVNNVPTEIYREVCIPVPPEKTDWTMLLTILLCSVFGGLFLIILGARIFKKLTQPDSQSTIFSKILGMMNTDRVVHVPEQPVLTEVTSVGQTPLLDAPDQIISDLSISAFDEKCAFPTHFPTHFPTEMLSEEQGHGEVTDNADSGNFNSGNSFSGYDSQKFPMDMGQGDIVDAYGPR